MIEVKGKNNKEHGVLRFDGEVLEFFGFGHTHASRRFHIDQISILIKESNGLSVGYEVGLISISCTEGCENIDELIEAIVSASTNPDLVVK